MTRPTELSVRREQDGERLDRLVAHALSVSRRVARTLIATGQVEINGKVVRILAREIPHGAVLRIASSVARPKTPNVPEPRSLSVVFFDRHLIVVDKAAGLLSEHDRFGSPSLESLVPAWLRSQGESERVWLVHRLDAGTSGIIVMARTPLAANKLNAAFREGQIHKHYLALCQGKFTGERLIDEPIGRAERTRHQVSPDGKSAQTRVAGLSATPQASLVRAEPLTGRTHQIRVHLSHLGHPLLGDRLYGGPAYTDTRHPEPISRPMLHAARLEFLHPKTGATTIFTASVPADFKALAAGLGIAIEDQA